MDAKKTTAIRKPLWTPARLAFTIVVLSLFAAFGVSSCNSTDEKLGTRDTSTASGARSPATGPTAKNVPLATAPITFLPANIRDVELKAVTGAPIKLSTYAGKVLVVNLWATWCQPCRVETPELVKLQKEFRKRGLEVLGLSTENPDATADEVRQFIQDYDVNYRMGWATPEVAITLMQGRDAIPQSFVIARDGRVVKRFIGFNPVATPSLMKEAIQEALDEKAAD
jgi:peroxiredoxin